MNINWKGNETWKRQEKGARLSRKARESQEHFAKQRKKMERTHVLKVKIICHKALIKHPGLYKSFILKVNIPLRRKEIEKRIAAAFPECKLGDS